MMFHKMEQYRCTSFTLNLVGLIVVKHLWNALEKCPIDRITGLYVTFTTPVHWQDWKAGTISSWILTELSGLGYLLPNSVHIVPISNIPECSISKQYEPKLEVVLVVDR